MLTGKAMGAGGLVGGGAASGISLVGSAVVVGAGTSTFSVDLTAIGTLQEGDLVIVTGSYSQYNSSYDPVMTTSGYTTLASLYVNETYDLTQVTFYKIMGATPDTTAVMSFELQSAIWSGFMDVRVYRGVDQTTPFDVTSTTVTQFNSAIPNPPSITPTTSGALVVVVGSGSHRRGDIPYTTTELSNFQSDSYDNDRDGSIGSGELEWSSGSIDPAAFSWSGAYESYQGALAITMALKPA